MGLITKVNIMKPHRVVEASSGITDGSGVSAEGNPLVSVVIPTYNRANLVTEAIDSVFQQTYAHIEIIVVDDGSTDNTEQVLQLYLPDIRYIKQLNGGPASARNAAMRVAEGDYIAWLDAVDLFDPDKIKLQVCFMEAHPEVVAVSCDFSAFDKNGVIEESHISSYYGAVARTQGEFTKLYDSEVDYPLVASSDQQEKDKWASARCYVGHIYEKLIWGNFVHPPTIMIRREAAAKAGDLDTSLRYATEYEYFIRLSRLGPMAYTHMPLLKYRYVKGKLSSDANLKKLLVDVSHVLEKVVADDPKFYAQNKAAMSSRLGEVYLKTAGELAFDHKMVSLRYLLKALSVNCFISSLLIALVKILTPRSLLDLRRRLRGSNNEARNKEDH
jgi:glycosyltransferase involved in cell wall biosynthesis